MPTRCNRWFLLQILLLAQHVSGTIMPIIRSLRVLYRWSLPVVFGALVFKLSIWCGAEGYVSGLRAATAPKLDAKPNTTGSNHLYNTLELLMMGIMVPETCWASNKICNKNHLLHLVGILFPHFTLLSIRPIQYLPLIFSIVNVVTAVIISTSTVNYCRLQPERCRRLLLSELLDFLLYIFLHRTQHNNLSAGDGTFQRIKEVVSKGRDHPYLNARTINNTTR